MEDEGVLLLAAGVAAFVLYEKFKGDLFTPSGIPNQAGLQNAALRAGANSVNSTSTATYVTVGDTTFKINNADLPNTGFIDRRAGLVSALPSFLQFDFLKKWVYS